MAWLFPNVRVVIRGAGDLATGVAYRLHKAGFPVIMLERPAPLFVRRTVSLGNAIFEGGRYQVEGITGQQIAQPTEADAVLEAGAVPILVDDAGQSLPALAPQVLVDARMMKQPLDTSIQDAPLVLALGPGYTVGQHCHAVIETNRGHHLGRVIWEGAAEADTGTPGRVAGYAAERVLRAPAAGYVIPVNGVSIGTPVEVGQAIATIGRHRIVAGFPGIVRGLVHPSVSVWEGLKIGDIDARNNPAYCYTVSDKSLAIGGGVLEAVLSAPGIRAQMKVGDHATF